MVQRGEIKMKNKPKNRTLLIALALLLAFAVALTACGDAATQPQRDESADASSDAGETPDTTLRVGMATDMTSLDYAFNYTIANFQVVDSVNSYLLRFDRDGNMKPEIATSWEAVDALTYVYRIRDDARFSDGTLLTAEDVVFSMRRIMDPALASDLLWAYKNVASVEATGDFEVTVRLSAPDATWQYIPATPGGQITSKAYAEAHANDFGTADGLTIGTGPYKVDYWKTGSEIGLSRNEYYYGEAPAFEKIVLSVIGDESAMALAMTSGRIDFAVLQSSDLAQSYKDAANADIFAVEGITTIILSFNSTAGPFADPNLRKAVASLVDVQGLTEAQYAEYAVPGGPAPFDDKLYLLDPDEWARRVSEMPAYAYDLEKAAEYLAASSYAGETLNFSIIESNNAYANIAQAIQAAAAGIGIDIEINRLTTSEYYAAAYGGDIDADGHRKYDMMINRWIPDFVDPAGVIVPFYRSDNIIGGANYAAYSNPDVDGLLEEQELLTDNKERSALLLDALDIAAEDCPYKALSYPKTLYAKANRVAYDMPGFWIYSFNFGDFKLASQPAGVG
jgi:peptide/nickel transport system substrate-binding protein